MEHYLDNSATTACSEKAAEKAMMMMTKNYGNPSSLHGLGLKAENELRLSREIIAARLGASAREIYFTSGGTESNNLALFGAADAMKRRGNKIIISAVEHSSVIEAASELERLGFEVVRIMPRSDGVIDPDGVLGEVDAETVLVSVMLVNNETGAVMPVDEIFRAVKKKNSFTLCHTDAVQAFGKIPISVKKLGADLLSVSAHKVHAPKGCGALYIRRGVRITPRTYGGEQEMKLRPGTEAAPLIAAFGEACTEFDFENDFASALKLNSLARKKLSEIGGIKINSPDDALPYILNFSVDGIRSETMLHHLESMEVYVSSGSACAKGKPSYVLSAMGLGSERADCALRVSFSKYNSEDDIKALCSGLRSGIDRLVHR